MANNHYLQRNVFSWLEPIYTHLGFDPSSNVTWANENAVRPDMTHWIAMSLTNVNNVTNNEVRIKTNAVDADRVDEVIYKRSVVSLRINIFGEDAMVIANYIQQMISLDEHVESAGSLGIGYVSTSVTQDLSDIISGQFKTRAMFSILFNHTDRIGDSSVVEPVPLIPSLPSVTQLDTSVGTIGQVTIIGDDQDGKEIINKTIVEP